MNSMRCMVLLAGVLSLTLASLEALPEERFVIDEYEFTVISRPHYVTLPSGQRGVGRDLVVDIYKGGKRVAAITDNFRNGYGVLKDYGPQPGFNTIAETEAWWQNKDSIETYWEPIGGLILINNIPDANLRRSLTAKWAALYRRIFAAVSRRTELVRFTADDELATQRIFPGSH